LNEIYFGADYEVEYTRVWVQKETEEENRSMENERGGEIDGCCTVEAFLFLSLPHPPVTNPQTSLLSVKLQAE
jgi:hypothetical protein